MNKTNFAALLLGVFLISAPGYAQQTAPQGMIDPKALEAANELVHLTDTDSTFKGMAALIGKFFMPLLVRDNPSQGIQLQKIVTDVATKDFNTYLDELLSNKAVAYARLFSPDEIKEIIAFYETPIGKKMIAVQPQLAQQMTSLNQGVIAQGMKQSRADIVEELKKEGLNVPKEMTVQ